MKKSFFAITISISCIISGGFKTIPGNKQMGTAIQFRHWAGNKELKLFEETYINDFGEPFVISKFKYYVSGVVITDKANKETAIANRYYLVNEEDSLSKRIELPYSGTIQAITFTIGVDSIRNVSGVQTGSLDPVNGMFWTWNSGYVFAKLEGQSDSSHAPAHSFSWHVGGFRQQENALKKIRLNVEKNIASAGTVIVINADILKWFNAAHPLKIAASPVCHQPGRLAMQVADNYSTMFSVSP